MDVNRIRLLVVQLRKRLRGLALIQDRIQEDVNMFKDADPELREIFEETRKYYLDHLGITLAELREAMHTAEIELPPDEIFVEKIMKRVKPMTRRYLERLVQTGRLAKCDMECIIHGGYTSVEAFFEDVYSNVESFGAKDNPDSSSDSEESTSSIEIYDEDGFLTLIDADNQEDKQGDPQDDDTDPQKKAATDEPKSLVLSSGDIVPPVKLEAPSNSPEDIESEIEKQPSPEASKLELSVLDIPSEEKEASPETESSNASDVTSLSESTTDDGEHTEVEGESESESESDDAGKSPQPFLRAIPKTSADADGDSDEQKEGDISSDDILDTWLESHKMFYWQYEIVFAAILTSFRFRERFQSARDTYKADPFADWE
ncbi:hypothetical protein F4814DRAFT_455771 [Daldinia grandis]|nr:hypothetical protein F4814DRAFT_455771 [Daldinia grandis]